MWSTCHLVTRGGHHLKWCIRQSLPVSWRPIDLRGKWSLFTISQVVLGILCLTFGGVILLHWRRSVILADTSLLSMLVYLLHNCLLELRVSEWKHGIWSHWHQAVRKQFRYQPITQTPTEVHLLFPIILMPLRHPYCQAFPYCPNVSGKVEEHGTVSNHQPSCSEFCPMTIMSSPYLEPDDIWIQKNNYGVSHQGRSPLQLPLVYHVSTRGIQVPSCTWSKSGPTGDVTGVSVGRYRSLYATPA